MDNPNETENKTVTMDNSNEPPENVEPDGKFGEEKEGGRDRWPSRVGFYLAAVGSAVGFGNVWRFPALAADYGGGAFFIPYLMALFLVGLPVLFLEIALGQYYQTSNIGVFGSFHKTFRGVGISSACCAYILVTYYSMLLSWVTRAFFDTFGKNHPWDTEDLTGEDAVNYFFNDVIGMDTLGDDLRPTRIVGPNVGYSVIVFLTIYACIAFGMKWTGRIAYFTMGLPILLLFIFLFKSISLPGASDGIEQYIGQWDMSVLKERPDVWSTAVSQIFFSLSVTFGTMPAYGSHCPRGEPAFTNSVVVGCSNCMFSFIAGFAVFAGLGHLAYLEGVEIEDLSYGGFSLVFGTWPVVFNTFPGGIHWVRLLFINLFLLGIDSAFSIIESPIAVALDHMKLRGAKKWKVVLAFCFSAFLFSLIYATDAGLIFLDTVDFYINFVFLLLGFFESFGAGWVFGIEQQVARLGKTIVFTYMATNFGSIIVACGFWFGLDPENAVWGGFVALGLCYFTGLAITFFLLSKKMAEEPEMEWTWSSIVYEVSFRNVMELGDQLSSVVGYVPKLWGILMRQLIPHILLILFINLAWSENGDGDSLFGHYEGYVTWPFQVLGFLVVIFAAFWILLGLVKPDTFAGFDHTVDGPIKAIGYTEHGSSIEDDTSERPAKDLPVSKIAVEEESEEIGC